MNLHGAPWGFRRLAVAALPLWLCASLALAEPGAAAPPLSARQKERLKELVLLASLHGPLLLLLQPLILGPVLPVRQRFTHLLVHLLPLPRPSSASASRTPLWT